VVSAPEQLNPDSGDPTAMKNSRSAEVAFENGLNGIEETCQQGKIIIVNEINKENENINYLNNKKETAAASNGTQKRFSKNNFILCTMCFLHTAGFFSIRVYY
jgi:hypothetical protein